jgi:inner membrane protein
VYRKGHYGVALLVFAPIGAGLILLGLPAVALLTGGVMLWLAMLPDVDHRLPLIGHRGPTHSFLFAGLVGTTFGAAGYLLGDGALLGQLLAEDAAWAGGSVRLQVTAVGFAVGCLTVLAHLLGDALTPAGVNFLWPLSDKTYSLSLTRADNTLWNYGLLAAGVFVTGAALYLASLLAVS